MSLNLKTFNRSPARVFLATLPVLEVLTSLERALSHSVIIAAGLVLTAAFFALFLNFFPPRLTRVSYFIWLAVLSQIIFYLGSIHPLWIMSLALLMPEEIFKKELRWSGFKRALFRSVFFMVLMIYLGAARQMFCEQFWVWSFYLPAGSFLLLAFASFMWQNQPGHAERYKEEGAL